MLSIAVGCTVPWWKGVCRAQQDGRDRRNFSSLQLGQTVDWYKLGVSADVDVLIQ